MSNETPLIWTEIGRKPGKYVLNAIAIHKELFPSNPRFLIVSKEYAKKYNSSLLTLLTEDDIKINENTIKFNSLKKAWSYQHVTYWINTTKRFFIIEDFMTQLQYKKAIHLESDCLLLNIDYINNLLTDDNWGIKYTKHDNFSGCASTFVINNIQNLQNFNSFVIENWKRKNITDMVLLHEYSLLNKNSNYLPSDNLNNSSVMYDSVSVGRYFLGRDARNSRFPFSTRGTFDVSPGAFNPSLFKFVKNGNKILLANIENPDANLDLGCIHVHSKRIPKNYRQLVKILIKDGTSKRGFFWRLGRLDFTVVGERVATKIHKLLFFTKRNDLRFR
jgi:hypothetical protein